MASASERELLRRARDHLDEWVVVARDRAYGELFEGDDAMLTDEKLRTLDRIDSDLARGGGDGIWGADSYGIVAGTTVSDESEFRVVCTYHPEIPYEDYRGEESLDEPERDAFNDVLWEYGERVASYAQESLDAFVERVDGRGE